MLRHEHNCHRELNYKDDHDQDNVYREDDTRVELDAAASEQCDD
jgi:hypothetical protein